MTALDLPGMRWLSLFTGYGGLDAGVHAVAGGELVAVAEHEPPKWDKKRGRFVEQSQAPARLLAHRFPNIPNLGDVSRIDWSAWRGRVDGVTAGFPCQDVSSAGLRNGMMRGTRSGLWYEAARAINELQPSLVVIENVPGLRSARAGDPEESTDEEIRDLEPDSGVGEIPNDGMLDLFSGEPSTPFSATWPSSGSMRNGEAFELPTLEPHTVASAYSSWRTDATSPESTGGGVTLLPSPTANLGSNGGPQPPEKRRAGGHAVSIEDAIFMLPTPLGSDGDKGGPNQRGGSGDLRISSVEQLFPTPRANLASSGQDTARAERDSTDGGDDLATAIELLPTPSTSNRDGNATNSRGELLLPGVAEAMLLPTPTTEPNTGNGHARDLSGEISLLPTPAASQHNDGEDAEQWRRRHEYHRSKADNATRSGLPLPIAVQLTGEHGPEDATFDGESIRWGKYRSAIIRAQIASGRLAPSPTIPDGKGGRRRLAARFVEWMMMLPYGWVTGVPGLARRDMLKMLGNGVVPAQASVAMLILLNRVDARLAERRAA